MSSGGSSFLVLKTRSVLCRKNCVCVCARAQVCVCASCRVLPGFVAALPQWPFHPKSHLIVRLCVCVCTAMNVSVCEWFCSPPPPPPFCATQSLYLSRTIKYGGLKAQTDRQLEDKQADRNTGECVDGGSLWWPPNSQRWEEALFLLRAVSWTGNSFEIPQMSHTSECKCVHLRDERNINENLLILERERRESRQRGRKAPWIKVH